MTEPPDGPETGDTDGPSEGTGGTDRDATTAAKRFLRAFGRQGIDYVFANLGTDHTPLLEAAAAIRREQGERAAVDAGARDGDGNGTETVCGSASDDETHVDVPRFVSCPHEFAAMSAAHGYAALTGEPQVVLVHVDVGTQNLGAAMHNAHRANVPVFVMAGLAPVTDVGHAGARDHPVHYFQDVFDQPGIVREYCRWTDQYRPPADPAETVQRGLERATADEPGPVYVAATREALETRIEPAGHRLGESRRVRSGPADEGVMDALADQVAGAERPLLVTSDFGRPAERETALAGLVAFAEAAGAGVVEHAPTRLCFPRDHELHVGFDPAVAFEDGDPDLVLLAATDVPWIPGDGGPDPAVHVVQVDTDPSKPTYPRWPFPIDETVTADPAGTLGALAAELDPSDGQPGRDHWRAVAADRRETTRQSLEADRAAGRLSPAVLSDALTAVVDEDTVVVEDAVTSRGTILTHLPLTEPGSYHWKGGAGLGWAPGAAVGAKLAEPEKRAIALVGDGSYLFANPTACAWLAAEYDAPTLTVIYDNRGWKAVEQATTREHPRGAAAAAGVPESTFDQPLDLSAPARAVDAHTAVIRDGDELPDALEEAVAAVDDGTPAVVDVKLDKT